MTETFDQLVQRKAEDHLNACMEAIDDDEALSPAYGPFCGCNTCTVREILSVTWDLMEAEARRRVLAEMSEQTYDTLAQLARDRSRAAMHPTEIEDLCDADD